MNQLKYNVLSNVASMRNLLSGDLHRVFDGGFAKLPRDTDNTDNNGVTQLVQTQVP